MRLYEIPHAIRAIEAMIEEAEGELTPETEALLTQHESEFERKAEWIALLAREAIAEAGAIKAEEDRLNARRRTLERRADGLKRYLHECMTAANVSKIKGDLATLGIQRNSVPTIVVEVAPEALPERFRRVRVESDGTALRDAFKAGEKLPAGVTAEYGTHLRIR
jgi:vacuolar-type H+-ATPase subunit E/Vma4